MQNGSICPDTLILMDYSSISDLLSSPKPYSAGFTMSIQDSGGNLLMRIKRPCFLSKALSGT